LDKRETIHHMEDPELNQLKNAYVKLIRWLELIKPVELALL
jgi:hypothetical protein